MNFFNKILLMAVAILLLAFSLQFEVSQAFDCSGGSSLCTCSGGSCSEAPNGTCSFFGGDCVEKVESHDCICGKSAQ